ncbi:MAG: TssA family type VI secretion system protein [Zoogloeaceae bacterium]|jgi:type VI secretion system protein VasJ|nr:TssA family type VI secretion system protein [Zoogloeaceae bacterium]
MSDDTSSSEKSAEKLPTLSVGGTPIPGDVPAGQSVRDDARFAEMRQEIDLLVAVRADAVEPNWKKLIRLGEELLGTLGKDISVASWLAAAYLREQGEEGLRKGAAVLADLCAIHWEGMFPPVARMRARVGAVDWWQDQVDAWLEKQQPQFLPADLQTELAESLHRLEESFTAHVPDSPLRIYALAARLHQIPSPPEPKPASPPPVATPDNNVGESAPASTPSATFAGTAFNVASIADCARFCLDAAETQLRDDSSHPASYTLRRVALWAGLRDLPPSENGRTLLPAPEEHVLPGLTALLTTGENEKAARTAEAACNAYIYWLTLHNLTARALAGLGASHATAKRALEGQVAGLLLRFPELPKLAFSDGTPFVDAATLSWLASLGGSAISADPFTEAVAAAEAQLPAAALQSLGDLLLRYTAGKEALTLYRAACTVCQKGELWLPLPFLAQRLTALVATHKLSVYDPVAASEALAAAATALATLLAANPENSEARAQYAAIAAELAGLQPHRLLS